MNTEHGCMVRPGERVERELIFCCQDTDECISSKPCPGDKFCVNNEGSFRCVTCDKACDGCDADGPDNCLKCAEGFKLKNKFCVADKAASGEEKHLSQSYIKTEMTILYWPKNIYSIFPNSLKPYFCVLFPKNLPQF